MNKITLKLNKIIEFTRLNLKKLNKQYLNNGNTKYLYNQQKLKILTEKIRFNNIGWKIFRRIKMKNYFDIKDKVAVITGASSGLGWQIAQAYASQGEN